MTQARRARWILIVVSAALMVCAVRLFQLQIVEGPTLAAEGQAVRTSASEINPRRGAIEDATGLVLADSIQTYHIAVNQRNILSYVHTEDQEQADGTRRTVQVGRGPAEAARQLAPLLGMDPVTLGGMMVGDQTYVYLQKFVDAVTYRQIRALDIYGIEWEAVYQRSYPNGNTAAPVIGTVDEAGQGSSGLEASMDQLLTGTPGEEAFEIAPNGAIMPGGKQTTVEPQDGATVHTTLRGDLQHSVQEILDQRVATHQADWGAVIMTEPSTGHILVMADSGSVAPDNAAPQTARGTQYAYEPGSVGKVITLATALEKGTVTPTTVFTVPYALTDLPDQGGPITDFHDHDTERLTATGILAESSNTGSILIGRTVSDQDRYDMMRALGLGEPTGVELAGESPGVLTTPDAWQGRDRYVSMFGQSYMMSALQEATVMATIANGGVRLPPRLVTGWDLPDGTVGVPDPVTPVRAMSSTTASDLIRMMESTVDSDTGTGQTAGVDGYRLAVKTGTADIQVDGSPAVVSTVAGVVPAEAPQLAVAVVLYNPKVGGISSDSAAPLFSEVVTQAVRSLAIPASTAPADLYPTSPDE